MTQYTCQVCGQPATHRNITQFAGTHWLCTQHLLESDPVYADEFTPLPTKHNYQYLLDKLQEEAAEIIQAVSKIRRFGPHNHHPDRTATNLQELASELEDFQAIVWALEEIQYLDPKPSTTQTIKKYQALMG